MQFLKTLVVAALLPIIAIVLLVVMAAAFVVAYVAWLIGVPVKVNVNGQSHQYRWLKRVYR